MDEHLAALQDSTLRPFSSGVDSSIPRVCAGVYTIWRGEQLIYVGHAGRAAATATDGARTGLADRLRHHATGRRSGDQFCVYVADRLVLQTLGSEDLASIASGELLLDDFIYVYVQDQLAYRYTVTQDVVLARTVEDAARGGKLDAGKPFLNPLPGPKRPSKTERAQVIRRRDA
jgi:hypothetical protein